VRVEWVASKSALDRVEADIANTERRIAEQKQHDVSVPVPLVSGIQPGPAGAETEVMVSTAEIGSVVLVMTVETVPSAQLLSVRFRDAAKSAGRSYGRNWP
jgi:hypothetical protein